MKCTVSIVMPSYNQFEFLPRSIESVLNQDYQKLELIVADGGSDDGSVDFLSKTQAKDARLKWFSEPDDGPAQAINKALKQAQGTIIGWLNSDDLYTPGAISRAVQHLESHAHSVMVYGHAEHIDINDKVINRYPTQAPIVPLSSFSEGCFICQPSAFFKRSVLYLAGHLDMSLKASFDFEYWLRLFKLFPGRIGFLPQVQAQSRLHSDCITLRQRRTVAIEGMRVIATHLGEAPGHWLLTYLTELSEELSPPHKNKSRHWWKEHIHDLLKDSASYMSKTEYKRTQKMLLAFFCQE